MINHIFFPCDTLADKKKCYLVTYEALTTYKHKIKHLYIMFYIKKFWTLF